MSALTLSKKKWLLTVVLGTVGCVIAFTTDAALPEFTAFAAFLIGTFGVADVFDKKFNGGSYDNETGNDRTG